MKDDWKKLVYEDVDFDGEITPYDIMENDENLRRAMEKPDVHSSYYDENDDIDDDFFDEFERKDDDDIDEDFLDDSEEDEDFDVNPIEEDEVCDFSETDESEEAGGISLTFSLSFEEPERTKPTTGAWKYYDEGWDSWDFAQALIDKYPELARHYKSGSDEILPKIVSDTYVISPEKAFEYLTWLWEFFPASILNEKEREFDNPSYQCRAYLIWWLIVDNEEAEAPELLDFVCKESTIKAAFYESVHEEHDLLVVKNYMAFLCDRKKFTEAITVYNAFKKGQVGKYSERDLADLWDDIFVLNLNEVPVSMEIYDFLEEEVNSLLPYSKRAVKNFARVYLE